MTAGGADPHTLLGAYVMDAVTEPDRARFEQHLAGCEACQEDVLAMREAVARLAVATAVVPRPELREQTMLAASRIRQLPPVISEEPAGSPALPSVAAEPPGGTGHVPAGPGSWPDPATGRGDAGARPGGRARSRWRTAWRPRLAVAAAVVLAAIAIGFGSAMQGAQHRLDQATGRSHAIAAILGAPDATMLTARITTGGTATVVMSHHDRALVLTAADLRELPAAKAYEVWLMSRSGARAAGMLPAPNGRMAGPVVVTGLAPGDQVGLTIEPAVGSPRPTTAPILMLRLGS
jgi:hypothetical protein